MIKAPSLFSCFGHLTVFFLLVAVPVAAEPPLQDPFLWLEDVEAPRSLTWVEKQNKETLAELQKTSTYKTLYDQASQILNAPDKIPSGRLRGQFVYNLWQDKAHVQGLWRRTTWEEYQKADPKWETVIDFDQYSKKHGKNYNLNAGRTRCLKPEAKRCMLAISHGGKDAVVMREFDMVQKKFVEGGFSIPEAKTRLSWLDQDTLFVGTDFGPESLTDSGYPRQIRRLKRGQSIDKSELVYQGEVKDVGSYVSIGHKERGSDVVVMRADTFFTAKYWVVDQQTLKLTKLGLPYDSELLEVWQGQALAILRSDFQGFKEGSVVAFDLTDLKRESGAPYRASALFVPSETTAFSELKTTKNYALVGFLDNVRGRLSRFEFRDGKISQQGQPVDLPTKGRVTIESTSAAHDQALLNYEDFLTPDSLYALDVQAGKAKRFLSLAERFSTQGLTTDQFHATSADGTKVPYFVVYPKDKAAQSPLPTLLYGYGGFEVSIQPTYGSVMGKLWLEKGGVYVRANIRGGGEFGPRWHQAALKKNRQRAYDDFYAVAEDLIRRKITTSKKLGIYGGSNGGLLTGVAMIQRPELFNAVISAVPLLDMMRYHKLLAGASWMGEYGNPDDPEMGRYIMTYSPYQNVKSKQKYPRALFLTSTKDDRVHPGHARKMVAKLKSFKHPVLYYEITDGGHGGNGNVNLSAMRNAIIYSYLWKQLGP